MERQAGERGRAVVRTVLFMAAMTGIRHDPALRDVRDRLVGAGTSKMSALIAAARKQLTILEAMVRDNRPWTPPLAGRAPTEA